MVIKRHEEIVKRRSVNDKVADFITNVAGSMPFLIFHAFFFVGWILMNSGVFGKELVVDKFPFLFLTTAVSVEAIILSTFVLMSQRRASKIAELHAELDYKTDLESEVDVKTIVSILERIAKKQDVDVSDLLKEMKKDEKESAEKADDFQTQ